MSRSDKELLLGLAQEFDIPVQWAEELYSLVDRDKYPFTDQIDQQVLLENVKSIIQSAALQAETHRP